jgi:hypothetical protein
VKHLKANSKRGGKRIGAGRKKHSPEEKSVKVTVKLWPALMEILNHWETMGYLNQSTAIRSAIGLWAAMWESELWETQADCFDLASHPRFALRKKILEKFH